MNCPNCGASTRVASSSRRPNGASQWRRRDCKPCDKRFTTFQADGCTEEFIDTARKNGCKPSEKQHWRARR